MSEKPKITMKELKEIYEIEETKDKPGEKKENPNSEFESYTEDYDEQEEKAIEETHG